ncbi:phospholipase A and acyltransferase 1-like [Salvelinus alpinus]|uniref:phospholipase A and acyltransferase 1-like n=1 Tax=Salvelinus alpinus TaxID=8036 RepID=UPI0039FC9AE9
MEFGDMIKINRGTYNHWALYIGNGDVIHVVTTDGSSAFWSAFASSSPSLSSKGMIIIDKFMNVAAGNPYKIYNYLDNKIRPRSTDVITVEVHKMRGYTIPYDLIGNNCKHFVTFLRYGKSGSKQADDFMKKLLACAAGLLC